MKILIVDDSRIARGNMASMVGMLGYSDICFADNGSNAIKKYISESPDLVTMDITMPEMDGISALRKILNINPNAKILVSTSHGSKSMLMKALKEGALGYVLKPLSEYDVKKAINEII